MSSFIDDGAGTVRCNCDVECNANPQGITSGWWQHLRSPLKLSSVRIQKAFAKNLRVSLMCVSDEMIFEKSI